MLRSYTCKNYKPFRDPARLDLAPLTLVFGHNGSGKSALVRLPRLLLRALGGDTRASLPLTIDDLSFGLSFVDLVHQQSTVGALGLGVVLEHGDESLAVDVELQNLYDPLRVANRAVVAHWRATGALTQTFDWTGTREEPPRYAQAGAMTFRGLWPETGALRAAIDLWRDRVEAYERQLVHLGPYRAKLEASYANRSDVPLGFDGAGAPHWLREDRGLEETVAEWYAKNLGIALSVVRAGESFSIGAKRGEAVLNGVELGEGSKQSLPVVTVLRTMAGGGWKGRLGIFEQPELHLHDAAHAALADLFIDAALAGAGPLLVETHSEMFLLRVRRRIAEHAHALRPEQVAIYWVQPDGEAASSVRRMPVREDGWVEGWPQGVYDDTFREVAALQRAARARKGSAA